MSPWLASRAAALFAAASMVSLALLTTPAFAVTSSVPAAAPLIVIDPGHGGPFSNANANGLHERTVTLQIGFALRRVLTARGYNVVMTRTTDRALQTGDTETWNFKSGNTWAYARDKTLYRDESIPKDDLDARTRVANTRGAKLFISIHCNGADSHAVHGTETWASPRDVAGQRLAKLVTPAVAKRTGFANRGSHTADFYVLRWTNMPAILVESAFISNKSDARKLKKAAVRLAVAKGIADGVDAWFAAKPFPKTMARVSADSQVTAAAAISKADFPRGAGTVLVVRSDRATDAPGASALAVRLHGSLLLSSRSVPNTATIAEIDRLSPSKVILIGLDGAFDTTSTLEALEVADIATSAVSSIVATDRAELSAKIASAFGAPGSNGTVMLANAKDGPAFMSLATVAARTGSPIILTGDKTVGAGAVYLAAQGARIRRVVRAGSAFKPAPYATSATVRTLQYKDAARIGLALNAETYATKTLNAFTPLVVNSSKPGDVLTAAARAARIGQPLITFKGPALSPYTRLYITNRRPQIKTFAIIESNGSMPAVDETVLAKADHD